MEITIPYQFTPMPYMEPVLADPHRFQVLNWHRKARKTTVAINQLIRWANVVKAPFWYVGPSYGLAKRTVWDDPRMFPQYIPEWGDPNSTLIHKRETELRVDFKSSGGQIYVFGADRPDLMRGPNPFGVVLDEFSVMKPEVWEDIVQPIMRANPQAWCWFLFTPRGKNHAHRVFQFGQRGDKEWKSWKLTVEESGVFTPEAIENSKRDMPASTFSQELMCEFLEGEGSVFRGIREVMTAIPEKPKDGHYYVMGVDLAKYQDFTVITVYDRSTNAQVYQDRFQTLEWPYQKKKIKAISDHYNRALVVLDATGLGDPIADDLARDGVPIEPFKITEPSKKDLIEKLSISIEQKSIKMISLQETIFEFDNFSFEIGQTGRIRYSAPEGFNDDIVMAHALAIWSLTPLQAPTIIKPKTRIQQFYESQTKTNDEEEYGEGSVDGFADF